MKQFIDSVDRANFFVALGCYGDDVATAGGQHHYPHNAFGIDLLGIFLNVYFTIEAAGQLDQFCRSACVKAELIDDFYVYFLQDYYRLLRQKSRLVDLPMANGDLINFTADAFADLFGNKY